MQAEIKITSAALLTLVILGLPAFAQERAHRLAACKGDADKLCASEPRGHGKIRACLEANKDKLSPDCKTALETAGPAKSQ